MESNPTRPESLHPRRAPAHKSVSLRHSPPVQFQDSTTPSSGDSALRSGNTSTDPVGSIGLSLKPGTQKHSSGESSNAERWFESSNNNIAQSAASFTENEPPFFLRNSSSSETPPDVTDRRIAPFQPETSELPYRSCLLPEESRESGSDDFRNIIDDLTVENRKLKRRLKKYKKVHDTHLQADKLFEIRVHGLSAEKKKELEETLWKFSMGLEEPPTAVSTVPSTHGHVGSSNSGHLPSSLDNRQTSSHTSTRFGDSAYASMSASGQNSAAPSGHDSEHKKASKSTMTRQQQNVRSYLHEIPQGLLPTRSVAMSEKAKKKMVVRRMEQIFAGKGPAPDGHQHQIQQEEVAQSAAQADRKATEDAGRFVKREGLREAQIMHEPTEDPVQPEPEREKPRITSGILKPDMESRGTDTGEESPNQRPTRPLDLDPHRAQVPQENIDYMRHLGFSPADINSTHQLEDDHGWIYLNLLINMAQLHTVNVTPEFVKQAVSDYSTKFELTPDGRKIRWRGGDDITRNSSDSSPDGQNQPSTVSGRKLKKRGKAIGQSNGGTNNSLSMSTPQFDEHRNKLAYVPLFYQNQETESDDDFSPEPQISWSSPEQDQTGVSSGLTSSGVRNDTQKKNTPGDDGPIIFYNKFRFCTDLSGDRNNKPLATPNTASSLNAWPVGASPPRPTKGAPKEPEMRGPLYHVNIDDASEDAMDVDDDQPSSELNMSLVSGGSSEDLAATRQPMFINLDASGVGGVQPDDHFSIDVESRSRTVKDVSGGARHATVHKYPNRIVAALAERRKPEEAAGKGKATDQFLRREIISARRTQLEASVLPPPSFLIPGNDDDESDYDDDEAVSECHSYYNEPPSVCPRPQLVNMASLSSDEESSSEEEDGSESDGEVDLLASARMADPKMIREQEIQYDSAVAERLAEEIPAGSSAATAGGGSGFNTPFSVGEGVGKSPKMPSRRSSKMGAGAVAASVVAGMKRQRTGEGAVGPLERRKTPKLE
ncbi:hypothetical protein K402DRAFT_356598 [Aulographum hederae CBS 113979]|uniref:Frequency clock protein n=1 Tax=Aulographum hederae CBS 113979 TaxID=1176131 RepID=A0A6G1GY83_9PEZI|nr:hypothetical protein K402DRAFT_356598 [Aulographum hederae CBS 113979]